MTSSLSPDKKRIRFLEGRIKQLEMHLRYFTDSSLYDPELMDSKGELIEPQVHADVAIAALVMQTPEIDWCEKRGVYPDEHNSQQLSEASDSPPRSGGSSSDD